MQAALILAALGASGYAARYFFERQYLAQARGQLQDTMRSLALDLPESVPAGWCAAHAIGTTLRFTVIAKDGKVECDSHHEAATMESHATRPEVVEAESEGAGSSLRHSSTLGEDMLYSALAVRGGEQVLRVAVPLSKLKSALRVFDTSLFVFLVLISAILVSFAVWTGRQLIFPVGRLLVKAQGVLGQTGRGAAEERRSDSFGEFSELESSLERISDDLRSKVESLYVQREEQATLMSAISDAILAVDAQEIPLFFNTRFALLFGREELQKRRTLLEMFRHPDILAAFRQALGEAKGGVAHAIPIELPSGKRFFSVSTSPLRKSNGEVYGAVGIFHDVTDLKAAEQIRIDFVANVSHELRTPLTAIKGYADTLMSDVQGGRPAQKEFVEVISRNTTRLMSLINDLLDLSSLESNDNVLKTAVETRGATEHAVRQLKGAFDSKKQTVEVKSSVATVPADPARLEQVLVNLLDNASKYTPEGGHVTVSWEAQSPSAVLLRVRDTGPGIAPEHHPRLFERFYRVDKARSREVGGTGLGLAIVKHIMQRHQGSVWVESVVGQGATFVCRFPT